MPNKEDKTDILAGFFKVSTAAGKKTEWVNLAAVQSISLMSTGPRRRELRFNMLRGDPIDVTDDGEIQALAQRLRDGVDTLKK